MVWFLVFFCYFVVFHHFVTSSLTLRTGCFVFCLLSGLFPASSREVFTSKIWYLLMVRFPSVWLSERTKHRPPKTSKQTTNLEPLALFLQQTIAQFLQNPLVKKRKHYLLQFPSTLGEPKSWFLWVSLGLGFAQCLRPRRNNKWSLKAKKAQGLKNHSKSNKKTTKNYIYIYKTLLITTKTIRFYSIKNR